MARKASSDKYLEVPDLSEVQEGGFLIPAGDYRAQIKSVVQEDSREGNPMYTWVFTGLEGKAKGKDFKAWTSLKPEALWKLKGLLKVLHVEIPDSAFKLPKEDVIGQELVIVVEDDEYDNKKRSKVVDWLEADTEEEEEEERPVKRGRKITVDLTDDDDDEEEEERPRRGRPRKETKARDEDEDEDEEEDEKPRRKSSNGKRRALVSAEELRTMSEDDMSDLIAKHKLDVDLSEFRTPRTKLGAISKALDEKGLLTD